ncbi:MAG TPA: hypothetical protein VHZ24_12905 [Pirellulales bacterium]|jgi:hypothetical protein|nr:hypothetical protein [Pirellulales bacterium]
MIHNRIRNYFHRFESSMSQQQAPATGSFVWMRLDLPMARGAERPTAFNAQLYAIAFEQAEAKVRAEFALWMSG